MNSIFRLLVSSALLAGAALGLSGFPETYKHGVNLGGWLLSEPWMNPAEWRMMGGEDCPSNAQSCASSEWALARKLGQKRANKVFSAHWKSWFTYAHAVRIKGLGLDHVRLPLPFWIIEELVEAPAELYAQGGWSELKRGLRDLQKAGLHVLLDMHAMPGVAANNQAFAGNITTEVLFYRDHNYRRALTWAAILAAMTHLDPDFAPVVGVEAINEPLSDPALTPGLQEYYSDFVTVVRVIELVLGCQCEVDLRSSIRRLHKSQNAMAALATASELIPIYAEKAGPTVDARPLALHLEKICNSTGSENSDITFIVKNKAEESVFKSSKPCIATVALPKRWQWHSDKGSSLRPVALGPAVYEDHLYFSFGGVAEPNFKSYMQNICNIDHADQARRNGELPYGHGEFSLATNFNATHQQLREWGDSQRYIYSANGSFWTFWNFKLGHGVNQNMLLQWSYFDAVSAGIWPSRVEEFYNKRSCEPYRNHTAPSKLTPNSTHTKINVDEQ